MNGSLIDIILRRVLDITISSAVLLGLLPLWLVIAAAIRLSSPGPALYSGIVAGKNGRLFRYYKFRTMDHGNDDRSHREFIKHYVLSDTPFAIAPEDSGSEKIFKVVNDPRITSLGRILRQLSIDEVPQFYNVLRGEMSIVGPRPPVLHEFQLYDDHKRRRLMVKPGITGLAQIRKRGTASFSEMLELDLEYISNQTVWLDLMIMIRTIFVILQRRGYTH